MAMITSGGWYASSPAVAPLLSHHAPCPLDPRSLRFVLFRKSGDSHGGGMPWCTAAVQTNATIRAGVLPDAYGGGGMQTDKAGSHSSVRAGCRDVRTQLPQPGERSWREFRKVWILAWWGSNA